MKKVLSIKRLYGLLAIVFAICLVMAGIAINNEFISIKTTLADQQKQIKNSENAAATKEVGLKICLDNAQKTYDTYMSAHQLAPPTIEDGHPTTRHSLEDWQAAEARMKADTAGCDDKYR